MSLHKLLDDPANDFDLSSTITGEVRKEIVQRLEDELMGKAFPVWDAWGFVWSLAQRCR